MSLIKPAEPWCQTADQAARRRGYAARSELALRNAMEDLLRARMPDARMCHEMVMGEGRVRADLVAVGPAHIAAVEVKGPSDDTTRLLHQVGMYALCVPEVWMVVDERHGEDAKLIRHLMPDVGLITGAGFKAFEGLARDTHPVVLTIAAEATPLSVVPEMALQMLWAAELAAVCGRTRVMSKPATRPKMINALLALPMDDLQREIFTELRARNALWRADDPIRTGGDIQ